MANPISTVVESPHPWEHGPPILDLIRAWDGDQPLELPDEEPPSDSKVRFAPGALDGILTHHYGGAGEQEEARFVDTVLNALGTLICSDTDEARAALYRISLEDSVASHADAILEELTRQEDFGPEEVRPHARWLIRTAAHRGPLKLGIVLLGVTGSEEDVPDLVILARHDEFALYAAVAVGNLLDDPTEALWEMARRVHGWGKIHVVERLFDRVEDRPDIRAWLLRHGCANEVMPEYLAYGCAVSGRLIEALTTAEPDDELLDEASLILTSLLHGGPAAGIESYEEGVLAIRILLGHLESRCETLERLDTFRTVLLWLTFEPTVEDEPSEREGYWVRLERLGWTEDVRDVLATTCRNILSRPEWHERIRSAYASDDPRRSGYAWALSRAVGLDLWEIGFEQLTADPLNFTLYLRLRQTDDTSRLRRLVAFGESHLPLGTIAVGPSDSHGLGPGYEVHNCLDTLLGAMQFEDVFSAALVAAALRSPVVRNRNLAITALERQPVEVWRLPLADDLQRAAREEPNEKGRERLETLLPAMR